MEKRYLREILAVMFKPLMNQRGEVGDADDDDLKLDDDEMAVMLDKDPDEDEPGSEEDDDKDDSTGDDADDKPPGDDDKGGEESAGGEQEGEGDDENPVPQSRFNEVYAAQKEADRKLDLLKKDPDEYYRQFPDEKPAAAGDQETAAGPALKTPGQDVESLGEMVVKGGKYDGMTLNQVYDESPADANKIQHDYQAGQDAEKATQATEVADYQEKSQREVAAFVGDLATDRFGKKDINSLTDDEFTEVMGVVSGVQEFMKETGRGGGNLSDAFYLMNRDADISKAKAKGVKDVVNALGKGATHTVSTGADGGESTGFESYENMTREQLADAIDDMPTNKYQIFLNKAPHSIRNKFPDLFD